MTAPVPTAAESIKSIADVTIDPEAEPKTEPPRHVSGRKEEESFSAEKNQHDLKVLKHQTGWIGHVIGSVTSAPTNIAAVLIILSFSFIAVSCFVNATPALDETRKWAFGLVTLVVGYLFGSGTKDK